MAHFSSLRVQILLSFCKKKCHDQFKVFNKYSLRHRKGGERGFIRELFMSKTRASYERVRAFDTNNKQHSLSCSSLVETKSLLSNKTSLCVLLNVLLFSRCCTNSSREHPADRNPRFSSAFTIFARIIWRRRR